MSELEKLLEKEKQLKAKIQAAKSRESEKQRKLDTRKKILIGAMVLDGMKNNGDYKTKILQNLDKYLTKNKDRVLFELPEIQEEKESKNWSSEPRNKMYFVAWFEYQSEARENWGIAHCGQIRDGQAAHNLTHSR